MKTLITARHTGTGANGLDGCFTRWSNHGRCSGEKTAEWLNGLGEDDEIFVDINKPITVGEVRQNWLGYDGDNHIVRAN